MEDEDGFKLVIPGVAGCVTSDCDAEGMREDYAKQPEWVWYDNENHSTSTSRWGDGNQVAYIRADLVSDLAQGKFLKQVFGEEDKAMSFGAAIEALKAGRRVAREGWNGKGMYLEYVSPRSYGVGTAGGVNRGEAQLSKALYIPVLPWIGMKTADDKFVPWLASQTDVLADDWTILRD